MSELSIQNIKADERGLVATVVQEAATGEVIALCYLNSSTLMKTLETGGTDFLKAAAPGLGNRGRKLKDVRSNLDGHSLTILVDSDDAGDSIGAGAALVEASEVPSSAASGGPGRTADVSLIDPASMEFGVTINDLYKLIEQRKAERPEGSYTTYLFNSGLDKILKKIAEESGEVIIASKNKSAHELVSELADLFYHLMVLMVERGVKLGDVQSELMQRSSAQGAKPE
jgi:phosphoribosyl-ATP pyrophosphohydrolase/phosphoribosyl-AMP cyclohydrolase